jgi:cytochrome P450
VKINSEKYGKIFTIILFGKRTHIVSDYKVYPGIQKKPKLFSFNPIVHEMGQKLGGKVKDFDPSMVRESAMKFTKYLQGKDLEEISKVFGRLTLKKLQEMFEAHSKNGEMIVNLHEFVRTVLFNSSSKTIIGEDFDSDSTENDFFKFDDNLRIISFGLPRYFTQFAFDAKQRVLKEIEKNDFSKSCRFVNVEKDEKTQEEMANYAFSMLGASQTNTISGGFWMFYEIISNPNLKKQILEEIGDKFSIENYEESIDSMEVLNGAFHETMRFHNMGVSLRQALEPCTLEVDSKVYNIRKGDRIFMLPVSYKDPSIFENPEAFDALRYKKEKFTEEMKNSSVPFGGGIHLCPGRHFASNEIKLFCILMLKHFNCEINEDKKIENNYRGIAFLSPSSDIQIKITKK